MKKLDDLQTLINELNSTNSTNEKIEILKKHPECNELLLYTYDLYLQFGVSSEQLEKRQDLCEDTSINDIIHLLDSLSNEEITGHKAISVVNGFIKKYGYKELIYNIIDKNLKTRTDEKSINKAFPNLIPTFNVALAYNYEDYKSKMEWSDGWFVSRKIDGGRTIIIKRKDSIRAFSRTGKEFTTLGNVIEEIRKLPIDNAVFDGEMCVMDNDKESFSGVMKEIRRKDHTMNEPVYLMFDMLSIEEFENKKGNTLFSNRLKKLNEFIPENNKYIKVLEQHLIEDDNDFSSWVEKSSKNNWEGLILRKNMGYEGKRSKNLLKVKKFFDGEYVVKNIVHGPIRIINKETKLEETILSMVSVEIEHKGCVVSIGSGFTQEERIHYYNHPENIVGKVITIQYFEETTNQKGGISLRFPTFKFNHGKEREI